MEKKKRIRNPKGGLTAYGRKYYKEKFGNKLRPGVKNVDSTKSMAQKVRWAKWARRFYAQSPLPPLKKPNGEPTRLALTATEWGRKPPSNKQQARKIAAQAKIILEQYKKSKQNGKKTSK